MKIKFLLFIVLLFVACQNNIKEKSLSTTVHHSNDKANDLPNAKMKPTECIFDQATQTDDFLKEIPQVVDYEWDTTSRIATTIINNEKILIQRGGCDHFTIGIWKVIDTETEHDNWIGQALDLGQLLGNELDIEQVMFAIEMKQYQINEFEDEETATLTFGNDFLSMNGYAIEKYITENGFLKIGIYMHMS